MTNREEVLGFLNRITPKMATNAEIVSHTGVKPHQQVFQITRSLMKEGRIKGHRSGTEWYFLAEGGQTVKPEQRRTKEARRQTREQVAL